MNARGLAPIVLAALGLPFVGGRATGLARQLVVTPVQDRYVLPDPAYAARSAGGEPVRPRVRQLVYPTLGFPALVPYGGEMDLIVRTARVPERPADWHAQLAAGYGVARYPLVIRAVAYDPLVAALRIRAAVSARAPRDVYDLELSGPGGFYDGQPRSVRVYGAAGAGFRVAVTADHQLWDPSWKQLSGDRYAHGYPRRGEKDPNRAMERQVRHELELSDPDFVLEAGDLVFGLDYAAEYNEYWELSRTQGYAAFAVPGNHDGYAIYDVHLRGGPMLAARAALGCREAVSQAALSPSWSVAWTAIECLYGNVRPLLFQTLARDGLAAWRRTMGPPYYAFDHGPLHVVALNTYDGTPERRHAYALYVDAFDLHLGAPAVDNYGGYLGEEQLAWLEADLAAAAAAGRTIVVFGHHDPRGNGEGRPGPRYAANLPFPTDPLSIGSFKEWQYDDGWGERAGHETARENSATRLLRLLARYASLYVSGHVHCDGQRSYRAGDEIIPGVRAERPIDFVRVTAAAGAPWDGSAYWGYRMLEVAASGQVSVAPYDGSRGQLSVPGGNVWLEEPAPAPGKRVVVNWLARPVEVTLRFVLPERAEGYRVSGGRLVDVGDGGSLLVRAMAAPGGARTEVEAVPATGNRAPEIIIDELALAPPGMVRLTAARTADPDGVLALLWTLPDGTTARGSEVAFARPTAPAEVALEAIDGKGARAIRRLAVAPAEPETPPAGAGEARPPPPVPLPRGCGCHIGTTVPDLPGCLVILSITLAGLSRLRPRISTMRRR